MPFQHSPSILDESERGRKMLDLGARKGLREHVGNHFVRRAVNELQLLVGDDPAVMRPLETESLTL